jgi:hypothetical protein
MTGYFSNAAVYRAIAEEAQVESERQDTAARTPKPDGSNGFVIEYDPARQSFKQSLIAVAFSGIYLEALLCLEGTQRMGARWLREIDRKTYEEKLIELGVTDQALQSAERLRKSRKDLVHEKAVPASELATAGHRWAQQEASAAIAFIREVSRKIENAP